MKGTHPACDTQPRRKRLCSSDCSIPASMTRWNSELGLREQEAQVVRRKLRNNATLRNSPAGVYASLLSVVPSTLKPLYRGTALLYLVCILAPVIPRFDNALFLQSSK